MEEIKYYETISLESIKNIIKDNINIVSRSFLAIGYYLKNVRDRNLYLQDGYKDIWDFAHSEFGISQSWASRYMSINDKFSKYGNSPIILDDYKGFDKSKLSEMLTLTDEQLKQVALTTTVAQIKDMKKSYATSHKTKSEEKVVRPAKVEVVPVLSAVGRPKKVYPEGSMLSTPGCEGSYSCFSCGRDCNIRQESRYCRDAPLGNPFPCTTMNVHKNLETDIGDKCMFVNLSLADVRAGDKEPVPCCKECTELCGFRCNRSAHEVKSSDQDAIDFTRGIDSLAKEYEAKGSCPQGVGGCMRNGEEGEDGKKICTKCWKEWLSREKILASAGQQEVLNDIQESVIESSDIVTEELENVTEIAEIIIEQEKPEKECTNCKYYVMPREEYFQDYPENELFPCDDCNDKFNNWLPCTVIPNQDEVDSSDQESEVMEADVIHEGIVLDCYNEEEGWHKELILSEPEQLETKEYSLQYFLKEQKNRLDDMVKVGGIPELPFQRQKAIVQALEVLIESQIVEPDQVEQPELPILKNNDQRKEFIDSYITWPVWIDQVETGEKFYRYNLTDLVAIVVKVSKKHEYKNYKETKDYEYAAEQYYLLGVKMGWHAGKTSIVEDATRTFYECNTNKSALVDYLRDFQKKGV